MVVAIACVSAMARPEASDRLLTTCVTGPSKSAACEAATSAARLLPRPEISTVMRFSAMVVSADDARGCIAAVGSLDVADAEDALARAFEQVPRAIGIAGRDDHHHADAAVEDTMHFRVRDASLLLQPVEDRRAWPRIRVEAGLDVRRKDARDVLDEATAGDVGHALD